MYLSLIKLSFFFFKANFHIVCVVEKIHSSYDAFYLLILDKYGFVVDRLGN